MCSGATTSPVKLCTSRTLSSLSHYLFFFSIITNLPSSSLSFSLSLFSSFFFLFHSLFLYSFIMFLFTPVSSNFVLITVLFFFLACRNESIKSAGLNGTFRRVSCIHFLPRCVETNMYNYMSAKRLPDQMRFSSLYIND